MKTKARTTSEVVCQQSQLAFLHLMHACLAPSLAAVIALGHSRDVPQWAAEAHSQVVGHLLALCHPIMVEQGLWMSLYLSLFPPHQSPFPWGCLWWDCSKSEKSSSSLSCTYGSLFGTPIAQPWSSRLAMIICGQYVIGNGRKALRGSLGFVVSSNTYGPVTVLWASHLSSVYCAYLILALTLYVGSLESR